MLQAALQSLAAKLVIVRENFVENLRNLAIQISETARPLSETSRSFHPSSRATDPSTISAPLISPFSSAYIPGGMSKSDLYAWREIFQLYIDTEVFESHSERTRGELDLAETEKRLASFAERVTGRGLSDQRKLKLKKSRDALEKFLELNVFIINLKKVRHPLFLLLGFQANECDTCSSSSPTLRQPGRSSKNTRNGLLSLLCSLAPRERFPKRRATFKSLNSLRH